MVIGWGTPYVAYQDAAAGNGATVMEYNGASWAYVGNGGFTPGPASAISISSYHGSPFLGFSDGASGNQVTVTNYGNGYPTLCGIQYFYDATGNRTYRTDTCITSVLTKVGGEQLGRSSNAGSDSVNNISSIVNTGSADITANIFPNPTQGSIDISTSQPVTNAVVTLSDINGATIQQITMNGSFISFDLSRYASGSYMVTVKNSSVNFVFKVNKI